MKGSLSRLQNKLLGLVLLAAFASVVQLNKILSGVEFKLFLFLHVHDLLAKLLMLETIHVEVIDTTMSLQKAFKTQSTFATDNPRVVSIPTQPELLASYNGLK